MVLSVYILSNCSNFGNCGFISTQIIHVVFISIGTIGTAYCLMIVKGLDDKVDKDLVPDYKELIDYNIDKDKKNNVNGA